VDVVSVRDGKESKPKVKERLPLTSPRFPRYNRITRHACRHRRSCREGGDPV